MNATTSNFAQGVWRVSEPKGSWLTVLPFLFLTLFQFGCRRSSIVATVNGKPITQEEFWHTLESRYGVVTLVTLIDRMLLSQANRKLRLVDEFRVNSEVERRIKDFGGEKAFREWLRRMNMTEKLFRNEVRASLVLEEMRSIEGSKVKPSEKELRTFFRSVQRRFGKVRWAKLRVIETFSKDDAQSFYEQLKVGTSFEELASKFNIREEIRLKRGDIGTLPIDPTAIDDRLLEVIKKLKVGQVSKPIEIGGMWVLVKLEGIFSAEKLKFDFARPFVEAEYRRFATPSHAEILQKLRKDAEVEVHIEAYKAVERLYGRETEAEKRRKSKVGGG